MVKGGIQRHKSAAAGIVDRSKSLGLESVKQGVPIASISESPSRALAKKTAETLEDPKLDEKMRLVKQILVEDGLCPLHLVQKEVFYYFNNLGLDPTYFITLDQTAIANHILTLYSAKSFSKLSDTPFGIDVRREQKHKALYICNSTPPASAEDQTLPPSYEIERRIEVRYLHEEMSWENQAANDPQVAAVAKNSSMLNRMAKTKQRTMSLLLGKKIKKEKSAGDSSATDDEVKHRPVKTRDLFRVQCYRSQNPVSENAELYLWFFFVEKASFLADAPEHDPENLALKENRSLNQIGNTAMIGSLSANLKTLYEGMLARAEKGLGPVIEVIPEDKGVYRLVVCYRSDSSQGYFSTLTNIVKAHKTISVRKELDPLYGFNFVSLFLQPEDSQRNWAKHITEDASLLYCIPTTPFSYLFHFGELSAFEVTYCYCAQLFIFYFCGRQTDHEEADYKFLEERLNDESSRSKLHTIIRSHQLTAWSENRIRESMIRNKDHMKDLYAHFEATSGPPQRASFDHVKTDAEIKALIAKIDDDFDQQVLNACYSFNINTRKTNMWRKNKSSLVFEIDPQCIAKETRRYPVTPFCILMIVGSDFRGFHVRFSDISRGGVRLIKSNSEAEWQRNAAELFFENYSLALTQNKKNKDIPEGGSKGVILTKIRQTDLHTPFARYMDSILDMLSPDPDAVSVKPQGEPAKEDMIFIGPDENTAELMDWAALYARQRKLKTWKAFTTGKSASIGGIPHDVYGMTTRGVHQYVLGALDKLGLKEEEVTKCQTGGPDGDLGSNEILISKDRTISIVDGSGVLYDPAGLNRDELVRLAKGRKTVSNFDRKFLSKKGFLVLCEQKNVTLPDGSVVEDGIKFRNSFHLHPLFTADVFVPCGGRPAAVNMGNIEQFVRVRGEDGSSKRRFTLVVEGANLFITQDARLVLERHGVTLFKDASANKGGVTSSSCEVLAALALNDEEFSQTMCSTEGRLPEFYQGYAIEVQAKIESNARREFDCLWAEKQRTNIPISTIGDTLSAKINDLATSIRGSPLLFDDVPLRNLVLSRAVPPLLVKFVGGVGNLVKRVPDAYTRWIFAAYLASDYVYTCGLNTTEFTFMTYVNGLKSAQ
eukprot:c10090_g2_i1.p1 GENE.c10090_g2_i1~~c10090_g2_i1.p1  ORF type:complete len:1136 (+),score=350.29 c10090_g2_i1:83-3409(+)